MSWVVSVKVPVLLRKIPYTQNLHAMNEYKTLRENLAVWWQETCSTGFVLGGGTHQRCLVTKFCKKCFAFSLGFVISTSYTYTLCSHLRHCF